MKIQELIDAVNSQEIYSLWDLDNFIPNLPECIAEGLEKDKSWLYDTAVNVYKCEDGFVGIWGVYHNYEDCSCKDYEITCIATEYKEVPSVTYVPKHTKVYE